jgi:hypothetical protein
MDSYQQQDESLEEGRVREEQVQETPFIEPRPYPSPSIQRLNIMMVCLGLLVLPLLPEVVFVCIEFHEWSLTIPLIFFISFVLKLLTILLCSPLVDKPWVFFLWEKFLWVWSGVLLETLIHFPECIGTAIGICAVIILVFYLVTAGGFSILPPPRGTRQSLEEGQPFDDRGWDFITFAFLFITWLPELGLTIAFGGTDRLPTVFLVLYVISIVTKTIMLFIVCTMNDHPWPLFLWEKFLWFFSGVILASVIHNPECIATKSVPCIFFVINLGCYLIVAVRLSRF